MTINRDYICAMVLRGGPVESEYDELCRWFSYAIARHRSGYLVDDDLIRLWDDFGEAFSEKTMQGFVVRKPHGYHGDYEVIDRIYTRWVAAQESLRRWDYFFHSQAGAQAVRNRKDFFMATVKRVVSRSEGPVCVLSVGCGPARDVYDYLMENETSSVRFDCLDHDQEALAYARRLCHPFRDRVFFQKCNVIRSLPDRQYDLVWAGGLFDYFSDRLFVLMLRRLMRRVASESGTIVVGNFSVENPSRDYMEFGGWKLHHRSAEQLLALGAAAGIDQDMLKVSSEDLRVNLFLEAKR